jgi:hypothetical protein
MSKAILSRACPLYELRVLPDSFSVREVVTRPARFDPRFEDGRVGDLALREVVNGRTRGCSAAISLS